MCRRRSFPRESRSVRTLEPKRELRRRRTGRKKRLSEFAAGKITARPAFSAGDPRSIVIFGGLPPSTAFIPATWLSSLVRLQCARRHGRVPLTPVAAQGFWRHDWPGLVAVGFDYCSMSGLSGLSLAAVSPNLPAPPPSFCRSAMLAPLLLESSRLLLSGSSGQISNPPRFVGPKFVFLVESGKETFCGLLRPRLVLAEPGLSTSSTREKSNTSRQRSVSIPTEP